MIKIGIIGDIGSGKSYVAKRFGYPVFNADVEVGKLYKKNRKIFNKLRKKLPKYIYSFPINKNEICEAILENKTNLKKIVDIVHLEIRKKMNLFLKKNINKKIVILDIPLLMENKINKKDDILIFVQSKKADVLKNRKIFNKLRKKLPKYIYSFPINKNEICEAILENKTNLKKIVDIVHLEIRKKMNLFLKKNINKKIVILDIPLLMENKINKKDDILIFVQSKKADVLKRLKKRKNFNLKLFKRFKKIQLPLEYKRRKSTHIIKNNFTENSVRVGIKNILKKIL